MSGLDLNELFVLTKCLVVLGHDVYWSTLFKGVYNPM